MYVYIGFVYRGPGAKRRADSAHLPTYLHSILLSVYTMRSDAMARLCVVSKTWAGFAEYHINPPPPKTPSIPGS